MELMKRKQGWNFHKHHAEKKAKQKRENVKEAF